MHARNNNPARLLLSSSSSILREVAIPPLFRHTRAGVGAFQCTERMGPLGGVQEDAAQGTELVRVENVDVRKCDIWNERLAVECGVPH